MTGRRGARDMGLTALLIAPDRRLADQFTATLAETRTFQVLADLKSYPPRHTLDIRMRQLRPETVLIDVSSDIETAVDLIQFVAGMRPLIQVVGLHGANLPETIVRVLRAGASEFLCSPFEQATQREALGRLRRLRQQEFSAEPELGKVVVITSAKPGAGSSTLATHLAHSLRKAGNRRVLLMDLDLAGGTIAFYLKLQVSNSVVDAFEQAGRLDAGLWSAMVVPAGGVDVLPAPELPYTDPVEPNGLHDVFEYARLLYDYVIVDTPSVFHRVSLLAISESDQAFLVSTGDLASLHLARKAVNLLAQLGFGKERYQIVVNRLSRKDGIGGADIEKIFNAPVHASIPNDYFSLHRVISLGQPLPADCELGRSIAGLAARVAAGSGSEAGAVPAEAGAGAPVK